MPYVKLPRPKGQASCSSVCICLHSHLRPTEGYWSGITLLKWQDNWEHVHKRGIGDGPSLACQPLEQAKQLCWLICDDLCHAMPASQGL